MGIVVGDDCPNGGGLILLCSFYDVYAVICSVMCDLVVEQPRSDSRLLLVVGVAIYFYANHNQCIYY